MEYSDCLAASKRPRAKSPREPSRPKQPASRRPFERSSAAPAFASSPELNVGHTTVGRETLEAIAAELAQEPAARPHQESGPDIVVGQSAIGRETLAAIEAELAPTRVPNRRRSSEAQAVSHGELGRGRRSPPSQTPRHDLFEEEEVTLPRVSLSPSALPAPISIFQMLTFVVKSARSMDLSTETRRRRFVEQHLRHGLGNHGLDSVINVDATPGPDAETTILRVWCRVPGNAG